MIHFRVFPALLQRQASLLNEIKLGTLSCTNFSAPVSTQKRSYRFGRRTDLTSFYVSPKWFDQKFLKNDETDNLTKKSIFNNDARINHANAVFDQEKERQKTMVSRIEKIEVQLEKPFPTGENYILMMNQNLSTPYDCASHISQLLRERSALAVVDGDKFWHMHQPLEKSCQLRLLHFLHPDTSPVNYAFWRSCSMLLASIVKKAFKEQFSVKIISQPISDIKGGSFVCDAVIPNLTDWSITPEEIRVFTSMLWDEINKSQIFERLEVDLDIANQLFEDRPNRLALLESKVKNENQNTFQVYRINDYIDLCNKPMIANTNQIGTIYLTAVHPLKTPKGDQFYRFQGIALPKQLHVNPYIYTVIKDRAKQLNKVGLN